MRVVVAGGHGTVARALARQLTRRDGNAAVGLVRDPDQFDDVRDAGGQPVRFDLESGGVVELSEHLAGADAVVFAAGAGPGSGAGRTDAVDRAGPALLAEAARRAGVRRYLLLGAMGVDPADPDWQPPAGTGEAFAAYLRAKAAAERDLAGRDLAWTVLRPGALTDGEATGTVRLAPPPLRRGEIARADVAAVLAALLAQPRTAGMTLECKAGRTPIDRAVAAVTHAGADGGRDRP